MALLDVAADAVAYCAETRLRIGLVCLYEVVVTVAINVIGQVYVDGAATAHGRIADLPLPDVRFGYTPVELHDLYASMGPVARRNYILFELFDIFPYMPAYVLLLSTLITAGYMRLRRPVSLLAYLPFLSVIADLIENSAHIFTAHAFMPQQSLRDMNWLLAAYTGAAANELKWVTLVASVGVLLVTWLRVLLLAPPSHLKAN
ncbi:hypothetical protein SPRG_02764 [Saprolegnia parasitica CBS 223.65]|uniref:Uncharacterized protein n=1 Tax=Saprolegnia parasitica (strain CBS 223.65) TaxID=695850 RepID=A0A067CSS1_SAPPC|nr:hypothetical protein SPRG_02764 [Saprolegnia parasitica CBS 223.65]KDO32285.1 hypothetical protein SPRG_02764 [Saprolegnia parasitica CBS 223.65]|eukprot:XP_012196741.1 hypothetical protein SPRG_02764 [Saprolegnia parasitica CBS 223.65]